MTEAEEMEELRFKTRRHKFVMEGCPPDEAHTLAANMMLRDREKDPQCLRVCFECTHLAIKYCSVITDRFGRPSIQQRFVLQRCPSFKLKGKK